MKLSIKALALALGILWGVVVFLVGAGGMLIEGYGGACAQAFASIYPGYHATGALGDLLIGTGYGFVDGIIGGCLLAWLYNLIAGRKAQ